MLNPFSEQKKHHYFVPIHQCPDVNTSKSLGNKNITSPNNTLINLNVSLSAFRFTKRAFINKAIPL